jgi:hypothetical protein
MNEPLFRSVENIGAFAPTGSMGKKWLMWQYTLQILHFEILTLSAPKTVKCGYSQL